MKIGLSLSGGGVRATVFHLGVLQRLAESQRWPEITFISTVSGGTLCAALVFEKAGKLWPDASHFKNVCVPVIRKLLTEFDLEGAYKKHLLLRPWLMLEGRAAVIAQLMKEHWGVTSDVCEMPLVPYWAINATCYETGKDWRFSAKRMGDYMTGYVVKPKFPLASAAAASAAVPGLIGPLNVNVSEFDWFGFRPGAPEADVPVKPEVEKYTLWDGGVYDNLGTEAIHKPHGGFRDDIDFHIVSDASKPLGFETRRVQAGIPPYIPPFRLIDVATDQARALRSRLLIEYFTANQCGALLRMGNSVETILKKANATAPSHWKMPEFLPDGAVGLAAGMETTLRQLTDEEFGWLFQHGYEVAHATLYAYGHHQF